MSKSCSNKKFNCLGFSLSPHMKMEETNNHVPTSVYVSSPFGENDLLPSSSPKVENFLSSKMAAHHYGNHEMEKVALSLDSIYYQQNVGDQEAQTQNSLHILQQPQEEEMQYFLGMSCHQMYQTSHVQQTRDSQIADWISGPFSASAASGSVGSMGCGDLQSLSLSMSPGSQSSSVTALRHMSPTETHSLAMEETKKRGFTKMGTKQPAGRKTLDTFGQRTSQYRGVTRHRWTGRYEAHLWDNSCKKEGQTRKGRQVYLGGYDMEEKAARAYDCAALKYWGPLTHINFPLENYQQQIEDMKSMSRQEYVAHLRRKSSGFSRGASIYRGVTRHHQHGRWQARIGRVAGNKDLYLGTFSTQEEAAEAYDIAAIKFRGVNAVTNFDIKKYDIEKIMASNALLAGEQARRITNIEPSIAEAIVEYMSPSSAAPSQGDLFQGNVSSDWKMVLNQSPQSLPQKTISEQQQQPYKNLSFSAALQNLMQIESMNSTQLMRHDSSPTKNNQNNHFSDPSSLVSSLSSSREASPDKSSSASAAMLFVRRQPSVLGFHQLN